jgi:GNAT superfamily N-acetyltransferase
MLAFQPLTLSNWNESKKDILRFERYYPNDLRSSTEDFMLILELQKSVARIALLDGKIIGYGIGHPLRQDEMDDFFIPGKEEEGLFYIFNIIVEKDCRGKGFGSQILAELLKCAKELGFTKAYGHFGRDRSYPMVKKFGATDLRIEKKWEGSKEEFVLCEIIL